MKSITKKILEVKKCEGQATIELAVMFPVILIIAIIAVNVILFFNYCAEFDRVFKQSVSMLCVAPSSGRSTSNLVSSLKTDLNSNFDDNNIEVDVSVTSMNSGLYKFSGILKMKPTLFGLGLKSEIFGVPLKTIDHTQNLVVDTYKPGVIF